eukprot:498910_1
MDALQKLEIEEEYKFKPYEASQKFHSKIKIEFVEPREVDYIDCQSNGHDVEDCNVMKRILHLLSYYQQNQNVCNVTELDTTKYNPQTFSVSN